MNTLKDLDQFIGKKELSKTAKESIVKIFCNLESDIKIEDIVSKLLIFPQEMVGGFILHIMTNKGDTEKDEFVGLLINKIEPIKFGHLFRAYCSFISVSDRKRAFDLLFSKMDTELIKKDINKQIFQGLDKTIKECGFAAFLQKFDDGQKRNLNIFAQFLLKYFENNKSAEILPHILEFYTINNLAMPKDLPSAETKVETSKESKKPTAPKVQSFEEILELAARMYSEIKATKTSQDDEIKRLKSELVSKSAEVLDLTNKLSKLQSQHDILKDISDRTQAELRQTQKDKTEGEKQNADLKSRLDKIASGYGAAGQQEMDSLKGNLAARLKVSFDKFAEIKEKQPDMDYYEILILIIDEIKKTLKKNGIEI